MGALDFLFEGKPPPSTTTYGTTTENMPRWLSDYTQGLITRANAIAGEPYQLYEGPRLAGLTPDQLRAFDVTREQAGAYRPGLEAATSRAQGALTTAMPYISRAAETFPEAAGRYMDPYIENVINRASTLAGRELNERFLPSVERVFGAAGSGPRSSAYRRTVDRGVRDIAEGLQGQALGALSQGYAQAGEQFGADVSRLGSLGELLGSLSLREGELGGNLAELAQNLGLREAAGLEAIGATQQADTQRSLDLARADFEAQRDYPRQNIDWLSNVIRGVPTDRTTTTSETGPASIVGPSGLQSLGSLATAIGGISEVFRNPEGGWSWPWKKARGGYVNKPRGALRYAYGS